MVNQFWDIHVRSRIIYQKYQFSQRGSIDHTKRLVEDLKKIMSQYDHHNLADEGKEFCYGRIIFISYLNVHGNVNISFQAYIIKYYIVNINDVVMHIYIYIYIYIYNVILTF